MRKFIVKGTDTHPEVLTIIQEAEDKFKVLLVKNNGYGFEKREETLSKQLFESCLRTKYLTELTSA